MGLLHDGPFFREEGRCLQIERGAEAQRRIGAQLIPDPIEKLNSLAEAAGVIGPPAQCRQECALQVESVCVGGRRRDPGSVSFDAVVQVLFPAVCLAAREQVISQVQVSDPTAFGDRFQGLDRLTGQLYRLVQLRAHPSGLEAFP